MNEPLALLIVFLATFIGATGSIFLKKGSKELNRNILSQLKNKNLIFGIGIYALGSILYISALKFAELSLVYPITSLSYIWISLLSVKYLNEKMNNYKWLGIIFILIGVIFITR